MTATKQVCFIVLCRGGIFRNINNVLTLIQFFHFVSSNMCLYPFGVNMQVGANHLRILRALPNIV